MVAHLDFFSSFGEVVAHLKMKWLNGDVVLAHLDILLLIRGSSGSFKNEVAQFEMQWLIEGCTLCIVHCRVVSRKGSAVAHREIWRFYYTV